MVSPSDDGIAQCDGVRETVGAEISLRHRAKALASDAGNAALADCPEGLTESKHDDFRLAARRHEREVES